MWNYVYKRGTIYWGVCTVVCPTILRQHRNCSLWGLTSSSPRTALMTENTMLPPSLQSKGISPRRRKEGVHQAMHLNSGAKEQAQSSQAEDQIKISLLKACSDNLAQSLVPMGRREGTPQGPHGRASIPGTEKWPQPLYLPRRESEGSLGQR